MSDLSTYASALSKQLPYLNSHPIPVFFYLYAESDQIQPLKINEVSLFAPFDNINVNLTLVEDVSVDAQHCIALGTSNYNISGPLRLSSAIQRPVSLNFRNIARKTNGVSALRSV
jgi:hypothetical protein